MYSTFQYVWPFLHYYVTLLFMSVCYKMLHRYSILGGTLHK
jgi:hypothetical protein